MKGKISLGLVLAIIATLVYGYFSFESFYFLTLGDLNDSIINASIYSAILLLIAVLLWRVKKVNRNFKTYLLVEVILLIGFLIAAVYTFPAFAHTFGVAAHKKEIQSILSKDLESIENMYVAYDKYADHRYNQFEARIDHIISNRFVNPPLFKNCGFIEGNEQQQKNNRLFVLKNDLRLEDTFEKTKKNNLVWVTNGRQSVANWNSMSVVDVVNELDSFGNLWLNELRKFSQIRMDCENENTQDFDHSLVFAPVANDFKDNKSVTTISVVLAVFLYLAMLVPYLFVSRNSKNRIFRNWKRG